MKPAFWIVKLIIFIIILFLIRRWIHQWASGIKSRMLGRKPRKLSPKELSKKYSHAHDPIYIKKRNLEDKLLPKLGAKKTEKALKKIIKKKRRKIKK